MTRDNGFMSRLLPLFPLHLVAFPGSAIPLHIFEERYRDMVGQAEAAGTEFGIMLAKDGGVINTGCTVIVETILDRYPDGRFDVLTRGQRRFSIVSLNRELAYLRGEVEYFEDDEDGGASVELRDRAIRVWRSLPDPKDAEPEALDPHLSFRLAASVEDLDFQGMLLRVRSEAERLKQFVDFAQEYIPRREYAAKMKRAAPMNGSGHKPANM